MAMKRTLLELTQDILVGLDGDEVSSINDTAESAQVAAIVRQNFYELAANWKLPEHHTFFELTESSSASPTVMTKPSDVISISWIKYDLTETPGEPIYTEVLWMPRDEFFLMTDGLDLVDSSVSSYNYTVGSDSFPFKYRNDKQPQYYTTYDDLTLVFDSVDTSVETFLKKTKTWCWGLKESSWTHSDSFVPPLDHKQSNLLFQQAKAQCFVELKQAENPQTERKVRRALQTLTKEKHDINADNVWYYHNPRQLPNYGRK